MKRHFSRFAEQRFDIFRILQPRQLNDNAVAALPLNYRLLRAQLVNTAADDFNGLVNHFGFHLVQSHVGITNDDFAVITFADV